MTSQVVNLTAVYRQNPGSRHKVVKITDASRIKAPSLEMKTEIVLHRAEDRRVTGSGRGGVFEFGASRLTRQVACAKGFEP